MALGYDRYFGFDTTQRQTLENLFADLVATLPAATASARGTVLQSAVQNPAPAADVAALKTQFDALLTKLKAAGLMAS